jgi:hypothetical protein
VTRLIRSGTLGDLTESDIGRMRQEITAAAHARLEAVAPQD